MADLRSAWVIVYKLLICVFYVSLSIAVMVLCDGHFTTSDTNTSKQCLVRSTFQEEFVSNIGANPFFSSSQIIRPPPKSKFEVTYGMASLTEPQSFDITAFPTIIKHPLRDAAYLPVELTPDVPLMVMFEGGLNSQDANKIGYHSDSQVVTSFPFTQTLHQFHSMVSFTGVSISPITRYKARRNGTYHLLQNGRVVAPDVPYAGNVSDLLTAMYSQGLHDTSAPGVLPNVHRCITNGLWNNEADDEESDSDSSFLNDLEDFRKAPYQRGMCDITGQQATVDISTNPMTSITLMSSFHIYYLLLCVVWVSASFTVFALPSQHLEGMIGKIAQLTTNYLPVVWNLILLVYTLTRSEYIPRNNVIIALVFVIITTLIQMMYLSMSTALGPIVGFYPNGKQNSKRPDAGYAFKGVLPTSMESGGLRSRIPLLEFSTQGFTSAAPPMDTPTLPDQQKNRAASNDVLRFAEYTLFGPLLFVLTLVSTHQNCPTHIVQLLWAILVVFHLLCAPVANATISLASKRILVGIQTLLLLSALYVYITYVFHQLAEFEKGSGIGQTVNAFTIIAEIAFFLISVFAGGMPTQRKLIVSLYAFTNFLTKTILLLLMVIATENKLWKGFSCMVYDNLQGF
jgi:hypothetical protein